MAGRAEEHFHSPELQHRAIADALGRRGLVEVARVEDIDATGRDFHRAGIQQVLAMARAGEVDVIGLYDLSRLGRNAGESLRVIAELRELGVSVLSTVEQIDDSPEGQFMLGQFLGMAQLYSDQIGRRWRQVHDHMATRGRQVGQPPLGYRQEMGERGRPSGVPVVDPVLGPAVADVFTGYAAGRPVRELADSLSAARGRPVWPSQVHRMLRRRFYLGAVVYKGQEFPGAHEPLVDEATWEACQRRADVEALVPSRRLERAHALSGIAVCDGCGFPVQLRRSRESGPVPVPRLGCGRQLTTRECAGCGAMPVAELERVVVEWLAGYVARLRGDQVERAGRRARQARARADAARLRAELRKTHQARVRLAGDRARREIDAHVFADADAELAAAEERLARALAGAEASEGLAPRAAVGVVERLLAAWPDASSGERNRLLREVVAEVRLRRAARWREPVADRVEVVPR